MPLYFPKANIAFQINSCLFTAISEITNKKYIENVSLLKKKEQK